MASVERSIEVDVPVTTAYNQWTQFEEFPGFMEGVKDVRQINDTLLHWIVEVGGHTREWDAEITEQHVDEVVAWRSVTGTPQAGRVTFVPLSDTRTRVTVQMDYEPEGLVEKAGDKLGVAGRRVEGDLERFKEFIESRGLSTGGWRGEVTEGSVTDEERPPGAWPVA